MKTTTAVFPSTLGACADRLYRLRAERLALEAKVTDAKAAETALKEHLIAHLKADDADGIMGKVARVAVHTERVGKVENWDLLYEHIRKTKDFELLQRRVSDLALRERWADEVPVPGVVPVTILRVSITKKGK